MKAKPVIVDLTYNYQKGVNDYNWLLYEYAPCYGHYFYLAQKAELHVIKLINQKISIVKNGVNYHFLKGSSSRAWLPFNLNRFVKSLKPDVIIIQGFYNPLQLLLLSFQTKTPLIIQDHGGGAPSGVTGFFQRIASHRVNNYAFTAKIQSQEYIRKGLIFAKSKIHEIHEASSTVKNIPKMEARRFLQLENDQLVFLWVGRLDIYKDPITVLKGMKKILSTNEKTRFLMVFQQNTLLKEVNETIVSYGEAGSRIKLIGKVSHDELYKYYGCADYFVLGSHCEVSGFSLYEAMSCGCVPIVTDIPSFRKMTNNGTIGVLWKKGDIHSLEKSLEILEIKNYAEESKKAITYFNKELSFEAIGRKHLEMVEDVIKNNA